MTAPLASQSAGAGARVGLDIGGSKIEGVALDGAGRVEASARAPIVRGEEGVLDTSVRVLAELAERAGRDPAAFEAIGVGVPGQVDRASGTVRHAYNIGIDEFALGPALAERTGITVAIDNDVTAASIGAAHLMRLDGVVAYLNLGTGLAAGVVIDGRPLRGSRGTAGELGHVAVDPLLRPCPCGQRGCLETIASGSALKTYWPAGGEHPGRTLLAAVEAGDADARAAFDLLVSGAATAVRVLGLLVDPGTVVIGGGLRLLGAPLVDGILRTLGEWDARSPFLAELRLGERVRVLEEGSPAAAVGAALAATV